MANPKERAIVNFQLFVKLKVQKMIMNFEKTPSYIKNRIKEYNKQDMLNVCYELLKQNQDNKTFPIWSVLLLIKWVHLYGGIKYPSKPFDNKKIMKIFNNLVQLRSSDEHIIKFMQEGRIDKAFTILYSQQFYLQKTVYKEVFATQLKLYNILPGKYDIANSFQARANISITDFLYIQYYIWRIINIIEDRDLKFRGYFDDLMLNILIDFKGSTIFNNFLDLLLLRNRDAKDKILNFKRSIHDEELQPLEVTFFTLYPFYENNSKVNLIHKGIFNYTANYYVYDFLKANDDKFTTEFGSRLEKYIDLGLKEMGVFYQKESELVKKFGKNSKVIDFLLPDENVLIECKAIEVQARTLIDPTDDKLYNSLKDSILKAYFEQLITVAEKISNGNDLWGIIITYKELFWSEITDLYELGKDKFPNFSEEMTNILPTRNVFIIDLQTWDKIVQIVKDKKATIVEILECAKLNNSDIHTKKQAFCMHLDKYELEKFDLTYLQKELDFFSPPALSDLQIRKSGGQDL